MKSRFLKAWALALAVCCALPRLAGAATIHLPVPKTETMPNGLTVVWFLSDHLPVVDLALLVKSGYDDDPRGKSGTAQLLANVIDRGNAGMTAQEVAKSVESLGASRVVVTDEDTFTLGMHGLSTDADSLLKLLSTIALHPDFPQAEVARERDRMLDGWRHLGDTSESLASLAYQRLITRGTIYGRGPMVSAKELEKVGRDDVTGFYHRAFTPKNAILMVVGRVDEATFRARVLSLLGTEQAWGGPAPRHERVVYADKRLPAPAPARAGALPEVYLIDRPGQTQAQVRIGVRAPLLQSPDHYALAVANALTGEYFDSRLISIIRDKLGLTYSIGSGFTYSKELASWTISSATANPSTGKLLRKTLDLLHDLEARPVPASEVKTAKEYLIGGYPLAVSTLGGVATRWLSGYLFDLGPDYLNEFVPNVSAVTPEQVTSAVRRDLDLNRLIIVVAGDAKSVAKSLKASGFGVRRVSESDLE